MEKANQISVKVQEKGSRAFRTNANVSVSLADLRLIAKVKEGEQLIYVDGEDEVILDTQNDVEEAIKWCIRSNKRNLTVRVTGTRTCPSSWKTTVMFFACIYLIFPALLFKLILLIGVVRHYYFPDLSFGGEKKVQWKKLLSGRAKKAIRNVKQQVFEAVLDSDESEEDEKDDKENNAGNAKNQPKLSRKELRKSSKRDLRNSKKETMEKLKTLHNLGFKDPERNLEVLKQVGGEVDIAINVLLK